MEDHDAKLLIDEIDGLSYKLQSIPPVAIAVVDAAGQLQAFLAQDDVMPVARQTAIDKAWTAIQFARDTKKLEERINEDPTFRQKVQQDPRFCFWAGGVLIYGEDDKIIGAVAVSGCSSMKDHELATAGYDSLKESWISDGVKQ